MVENTLEKASRLRTKAHEAHQRWNDFQAFERGMTTPEALAQKARLQAEADHLLEEYYAFERSQGYQPRR